MFESEIGFGGSTMLFFDPPKSSGFFGGCTSGYLIESFFFDTSKRPNPKVSWMKDLLTFSP